jgi:surface antigen
MRGLLFAIGACALAVPNAAMADTAGDFAGSVELAPYLQCVPYARERSGLQIYGDARTWWEQAAGRYKRGATPRPGAVMTFRPSGNMVLGHVAAVSKVIDSRTVLLDHANWSPIGGRRGQVERGVKAVDVSPANDWSQVRVWYAPLQDLGTTAWPVAGFIYNERDAGAPLTGGRVLASSDYAPSPSVISLKPSKTFAQAFAGFGEPVAAKAAQQARPSLPPRRVAKAAPAKPRDPIDAALARYGS